MSRYAKHNASQPTTFVLSTLALSIAGVHGAHAVAPHIGTGITNTAYASYVSPQGQEVNITSNTVQVSVTALYAITLTTPPTQEVEAGVRVVWANTLTNNSNTTATVRFDPLELSGLSNIKIYVDSNKNGEFDANDQLFGDNISLDAGQSVNLWVIATTSTGLLDKQQLSLPLKAIVVEDTNATATANDSLITYLPELEAIKEVKEKTFTPTAGGNFDLHYTLKLKNNSSKPARPITVDVDGQSQQMVILADPLPANTNFKSAQSNNSQAKILFKTGTNSYSTSFPSDLTQVNELIVGYPVIEGNSVETVEFVVTMNSNISQTTVNNTYKVSYQTANSTRVTTSNVASTLVGGTAKITNNSGDYNRVLTTGSVNKDLHIEASSTACNASRTAIDRVTIQVKSSKTGDIEDVVAVETGENTGLFHYELPTKESATASVQDTILQTVKRDSVKVTLTDCLDASGNSTQTFNNVETDILIDPYGIVFDAKTGLPVAGATVTLLDQSGQPIGDDVAFQVDLQTGQLVSMPATQVTNDKGEFIYPFVNNGVYSFSVDTRTIPGGIRYTFTSDKTVYPSFSADKAVHPEWSYGGNFSLNSGDPALNVDIPIDPVASEPTSPLFVKKVATNKSAEIGDFEEYTVTVANRGTVLSPDVSITDTLPRGFSYVPGTMRVDGVKVADPQGGKGPYLTLGLGDLDANKEAKVQYRVYIGPNSLNGDGINRVRAKDGTGLESNEASAKIEVLPGALMADAFIVGKVFADCNRNGMQDVGELGVPGVRLYLENGNYVITDREGKYDFYGVSAKTHVLKVDRTTIFNQAELVLVSNRQAGDPNSRFVDLKRGELHRADFAIADGTGECTQPLVELIQQRQEKIEASNINLEQVLRADLTLDPIRSVLGDVRSQPSSGCVNTEGVAANCNVDFSKEIIKELKTVQIDPVKLVNTINLEEALETADSNELKILNLSDQQVLPYHQATVQVQGAAGTQLELWVNGKQVPDSRIGKRAVLSDFNIAGLDFIGVDLNVGRNQIELRQIDMMGNVRGTQRIEVIAPDEMDKLALSAPAQQVQANGVDRFEAQLKIVDSQGVMVSSRTPVTISSTIGRVDLTDLDPKQPGIQVFVEGGTIVVPIQAPSEPGEGTLSVESGVYQATSPVRFLPNLRPMIAVGIVEGSLALNKFDPKQLGKVSRDDGFEDELNDLSTSSNGEASATGRAAFFLKGKVKGEYLLTLAYDSDKDKNQRLFRDIRPDEYYPVYGDAAAKGFDAQSTSKLYVRVDKGRSYAMYGDYVTRTENDQGLSLGQYSRSLTGARTGIETDKLKVSAFAAETNTRQVVDEQRALGITGPYSLGSQISSDDVLSNSEKVEVIVRDRDNPGLIIEQRTLARFTDYEVDTFSNSIYLKQAVLSVDANLNPIYIRVTVESDEGGESYMVGGASASYKVSDKVQVGGSFVKSDDPITDEQLASVNTVVKLNSNTQFVAELARSENTLDPSNTFANINAGVDPSGRQKGDAARFELDYAYKNLDLRAYHHQADEGFFNNSSPITSGRKESGVKGQVRVDKVGLARFEAIRTEDQQTEGVRQGVSASVERALNRILALELGVRYYEESNEAASVNTVQVTPYSGTTVRAKLSAQLPWEGSAAFAEYEQDISDAERRIFAVGGNYQLSEKARVYARHEVLSSINGLYELNDTQRRNTTVFGIDSAYAKDSTVFSEYRVRDGISAREAEAALGLRNRWQVKEGVFVNASLEKVKSLAGDAEQSQDTTSASAGLEYLYDPNWKGVARLEMRWADQSDTILNTLGAAYKLNDDVTLLAKNVLSHIDNKSETSGDRTINRFQLGAAYRDFNQNKFDALSKIEYRYENNETNLASPYLKHVYILSNHANYHPTRQMTLSGQYAVKHVNTTFERIQSRGTTHLLNGRAMYDINERWDAGVQAGLLWSDVTKGQRLLLGAEVGHLLAANLWLSAGYNFAGFEDDDLVDSETTMQGAYMRFRFKFDEDLFGKKNPSINSSREPNNVR